MRAPASTSRGFTLVELAAVLFVTALICAVAAPGLRDFSAAQSVKSLAADLAADLLLARSEALKRNSDVTVARAGSEWTAGWAVTAGSLRLSGRSASSIGALQLSGAPAAITFNSFGRVSSPADAVRITVGASNVPAAALRCVELDLSGRARSKTGACA